MLVNAPAADRPVPFKVNAFVFVNAWPFRSRAAPEDTLTALSESPSALVDPTLTVPTLMLVPPVYVFAPDRVSVLLEEVDLVSDPAPLITPDKV